MENKEILEVKTQPSNEELDVKKTKKVQKIARIVYLTLTYLFLCIIAISVLFPFYWMLNSSLKSLTREAVNLC